MDTTAVTWTDRTIYVPAEPYAQGSGVHEWAYNFFARVERWGHKLTAEIYVEEEGRNAHGRRTDTTRAMRFECIVDGRHHVVVRYDHEVITPCPWSVTVDGERQDLPPMAGQMWWWKLAVLALAVHCAAEAAARRAA
ncbi:hypothetical protein ACFYUJ_39030 [Streptomyces sp. NPDC004520]|uniref:hypothetical protein n=1 Tax=Streptomyces sp. NPDC004520 TaxID=3364702 RepID=UPI0036836F42